MRRVVSLFALCSAVLIASEGASASDRKLTYSRDVAPIFNEHCVVCHRPNEIAPMSLLSYEETRPWAKSVRKAVLLREMPPWDADPSIGRFRNDISLSQDKIDTIVQWIDQGAMEGDPKDMPRAPVFPTGWQLGEPDHVIDLGTVDVPASGEDLFVNKAIKLDLPEDRWVRAVEVQVGNRDVLHHLGVFKGFVQMGEGMELLNEIPPKERVTRSLDVLSIWAAGTPSTSFPDGMGHGIKKDSVISFNMHFHPFGEAATDRTRVGLYFGSGDLEKEVTTAFALNSGILVPAGDNDYTSRAAHVFGDDSLIVSFFPHMHFRGKEMTYYMTYPDGRSETLLRVPNYDFNWQWIYYPEEPIEVPKGSRLDVVARYDNSSDNEANPNPEIDVLFGDNTTEEMLIGFVDIIPQKGQTVRPVRTQERLGPLLALHPPDEAFELELDTGGFLKLGAALHAPEDGLGTFYFLDGSRTFTITMRDIEQNGNEVTMKGRFLTGAADTIPFGLRAETSRTGEIAGEIYIGQFYADSVPREQGLSFTGRRVSEIQTGD